MTGIFETKNKFFFCNGFQPDFLVNFNCLSLVEKFDIFCDNSGLSFKQFKNDNYE